MFEFETRSCVDHDERYICWSSIHFQLDFVAYGYQLKNGEIRLRDIASNHDYAEKLDFTEKAIDFLTKIFQASVPDPARDALSRRDLEDRLFRPIGHVPDDFDPSVPLTPVITQAWLSISFENF